MDFIRKPRRRSCFFQKLYLSILVSLSTKHILPLLRRICCLPPLYYNQKVNWFWGLPAPWRPPLIEIPSCEETKASNLSALHRLPRNRAVFTSRSQKKKHIHQTKSEELPLYIPSIFSIHLPFVLQVVIANIGCDVHHKTTGWTSKGQLNKSFVDMNDLSSKGRGENCLFSNHQEL